MPSNEGRVSSCGVTFQGVPCEREKGHDGLHLDYRDAGRSLPPCEPHDTATEECDACAPDAVTRDLHRRQGDLSAPARGLSS